ncbi:MAG: BamA/TamA family outer membrane protein [Kofleriaceae bacterium]
MRGLVLVCLSQLVLAAPARAQPAPDQPATPATPAPPAAEPAGPPAPPVEEPPHERFHEDHEFGPVIMIEEIEITGNTATQTEIIRRALPISPGDILHASDKRLRDSRFKVLALGYFRDVTLSMKKGSARGQVIIEIHVVERGTFVLNKLWFGSNSVSPYWFGADVGERNLLGLGIAVGGGLIYAADGHIGGDRDQWAGELRASDTSLYGSRWGANGSLTLVHGSEPYRIAGSDGDAAAEFRAFPYRRFGGRAGVTYDATELSRISAGLRVEQVDTELPVAPTRTLADGRIVGVDLHLDPGSSRIVTAGFGFDRDTRADPILPHSGGHFAGSAEVGSAALGGSYDFATLFARYEHWWPLRDERSALGLRLAGGVVIGDAPRFDRIHISDVDHMLTPRALGLVLSNAAPLDILGTRPDKPSYGEVGGSTELEFTSQLFRGSGKNRVYGGDWFIGAGLWGLAQTDELLLRDSGVWRSLPIDIYADAGVRIDTDIGVFELTISNALGRVR